MNATELIALGYRQLMPSDVGKVFGVDLELLIKFDTSKLGPTDIYSNSTSHLKTANHEIKVIRNESTYETSIFYDTTTQIFYGNFGQWKLEELQWGASEEITVIHADEKWYNYIYVMDIEPEPTGTPDWLLQYVLRKQKLEEYGRKK